MRYLFFWWHVYFTFRSFFKRHFSSFLLKPLFFIHILALTIWWELWFGENKGVKLGALFCLSGGYVVAGDIVREFCCCHHLHLCLCNLSDFTISSSTYSKNSPPFLSNEKAPKREYSYHHQDQYESNLVEIIFWWLEMVDLIFFSKFLHESC